MTKDTETGGGVLRRMLGEGLRPPPRPLTVHRALRLALAQLADERFDIEIEVRGIEDQRIGQDALGALRLTHGVYFLTEGPLGAIGLACASRDLIAALIEVQTTGRIRAGPGPERPPTPTDAAMVEGWLDALLIRFGTMLSVVEGEEWTQGQRLGRPVFDLHQIPLELPDIGYRCLRAAIGFAPDGKQGELVIALPAEPMQPKGVDLGTQAADAAQVWKRRLTAAVETSPAVLRAILHRMPMPVAGVRSLQPGDLLTLPPRSVRELALQGSDGRVVAIGRLGMTNGMKAIRITAIGSRGPDRATDEDNPTAPRLDLDDLGLGDLPPDDGGGSDVSALIASTGISTPVFTPDDLPDLGDLPPLGESMDLGPDGTIPLDDLDELNGDLPPLDIAPRKVDID